MVSAYGLGLMLSSLTLLTKRLDYTMMLIGFLAFLAGPSYPPLVYPAPLRLLALGLPLTYPLDIVRHLLLGSDPLLPLPIEWPVAAVGGSDRRDGVLHGHPGRAAPAPDRAGGRFLVPGSYFPVKSGGRRSSKARTASRWSWVAKQVCWAAASAARMSARELS